MKMKVDVLYQFNEAYAPYAGVSITSLLENNKDIDEICIHVLDDNISDDSHRKLLETADKYERTLCFLDARGLIKLMKELGIPKYRGSYTTNLKLFLPMVISGDIEKLLYIDSDTAVVGSISPLFEMDMEGKPIAMCYDSLGKKHKQLIGLSGLDGYYNAGVILFDVPEWKRQMCTEMIVEHVKNVRSHYMSPDQDLLNVVLKGHIKTIDPEYNLQPVHLVYDYNVFNLFFGQKNYYTAEEIEAAADNPVILHFFRFLGQFPWDEGSVHPDKEVFDEYMEISQWSDYVRKPSRQSNLTFKIERWLYKSLPSFIFMILFKVNYEVFIKRAERDSRKQLNSEKM